MSLNEPYITNDLLLDINKLNEIVVESGEKLEGNLFYLHHDKTFTLSEKYKDKRNNYIKFLRDGVNFLEIGFNAGHSAALALHNFPNIKYTGIDICYHNYTKPCADYLIDKFDISFYGGDSKAVLNNLKDKYDCINIDGDHSINGVFRDLINSYIVLKDDGCIFIDDYNHKEVRDVTNFVLDNFNLYKLKSSGEMHAILEKNNH